MSKYKAVLFDADGVLTLPEDMFTNIYAKSHGLDPAPFDHFFQTEWADYVTGKKDLKEHIANNPELWQWNGTADELLDYWFTSEDVQNDELIALIKRLRASGIRCYLASEQEAHRSKYMQQTMFPGLFDGYFFTSDLGLKKSDPNFYTRIFESLQTELAEVEPREVMFFDDSQSKIDAALEAGISARLYTGIGTVQENFDEI